MLIVGVVLTAAAVLTLAALVPVFRAPQPPRWTRSRWVGEAVTLTIVSAFTCGLAGLWAGAYRAYQSGPSLLEIGAIALTLGVAVALWRRSGRRRQALAPAPTLVTSSEAREAAPDEPQPPRPVKPTRRAA